MKLFETVKDLQFVQNKIKQNLGEGTYATVKLVTHKNDNKTFYAVK